MSENEMIKLALFVNGLFAILAYILIGRIDANFGRTVLYYSGVTFLAGMACRFLIHKYRPRQINIAEIKWPLEALLIHLIPSFFILCGLIDLWYGITSNHIAWLFLVAPYQVGSSLIRYFLEQ